MSGYVRSKRHPELFKKDGSSVWWCFLPNPRRGRRLRQSTGHTDERAAYEEFLRRARGPVEAEPAKNQKALGLALIERIEWLKAARHSDDPTRKKPAAATIDFYRKKGKPLVRILGAGTLLSAIGHQEIRRYITKRTHEGRKGTAIQKELVTLSKAMALAKKDGIECAHFRDIVPEDFSAHYVPKTRWLTEAEVDALLSELEAHRAAVVAFIVATSATYPSEVDPVRPLMVKGQIVHLPGTKRETRNRTLRVPSHARKYLALAVKHLGPSGFAPWASIRRDLHAAAERLSMCATCRAARRAGNSRPRKDCPACARTTKFAALSPNDLRRTFVQWLVRSGVPNELVGPMAGHAPGSKMVETVYGRREATAVADLVELALRRAPKNARKAS